MSLFPEGKELGSNGSGYLILPTGRHNPGRAMVPQVYPGKATELINPLIYMKINRMPALFHGREKLQEDLMVSIIG